MSKSPPLFYILTNGKQFNHCRDITQIASPPYPLPAAVGFSVRRGAPAQRGNQDSAIPNYIVKIGGQACEIARNGPVACGGHRKGRGKVLVARIVDNSTNCLSPYRTLGAIRAVYSTISTHDGSNPIALRKAPWSIASGLRTRSFSLFSGTFVTIVNCAPWGCHVKRFTSVPLT